MLGWEPQFFWSRFEIRTPQQKDAEKWNKNIHCWIEIAQNSRFYHVLSHDIAMIKHNFLAT